MIKQKNTATIQNMHLICPSSDPIFLCFISIRSSLLFHYRQSLVFFCNHSTIQEVLSILHTAQYHNICITQTLPYSIIPAPDIVYQNA